jgi:hypothetical protein
VALEEPEPLYQVVATALEEEEEEEEEEEAAARPICRVPQQPRD